MSLTLADPQVEIDRLTTFLRQTLHRNLKKKLIVAVSGGVDSAISLTLATRAVGKDAVIPVLLPFADQSVADAQAVCEFNGFAADEYRVVNIEPMFTAFAQTIGLNEHEDVKVRRGNIMARCRMIVLFDLAKQVDGLVCGTENKSEHYLGYFTRFGDGASDIEPIVHLYKTQVRQLARFIGLPTQIVTNAPSAGLWPGQTDEQEMGFSYEHADKVLYELLEEGRSLEEINLPEMKEEVKTQVAYQMAQMKFKHEVPYTVE